MPQKRFEFISKANTLGALSLHPLSAKIPEFITFTHENWKQNPSHVIDEINLKFLSSVIIVRSSAIGEDSKESSHAGEFASVPGIIASDKEGIKNAIDEVFQSYKRNEDKDQVIIQAQVINVSKCGVIFTKDLETRAPYFVINYDDSIDGVTSGRSSETKTWIRYRHAPVQSKESELNKIITLAEELENITQCEALDIEFAIDTFGTLYLLQARPIATPNHNYNIQDLKLSDALSKVAKKIKKLNAPHPGIHGKTAIYSIMTDWNPAEIIGTKPRMLALSLYKQLIMDSIWAYQRSNYGYKNVRGFPLLISFLGVPYIDVRASFNSFIPATLDKDLTEKLVDYYSLRLKETPTDHDKVEFKVVYSCYYLNLPERIKELLKYGFTELELDRVKFGLLQLTNRIISQEDGLYKDDQQRISKLDERYKDVIESNLPIIDKIYWLIEDCKRFGTLPFAGLARAAFIAIQFLRSFVESDIISEDNLNSYLRSLNTVSKQLVNDFNKYRSGEFSKELILKNYGHLRPGTYDILSDRYDRAFDSYFSSSAESESSHQESTFNFSVEQKSKILNLLIANGINLNAEQLLVFIKDAIEGREYSKFIFTRSLSSVLSLIEDLGSKCGISKEEMANLDINAVLALYSSVTSEDLTAILLDNINRNKTEYLVTQLVKFPDLITDPDQIYEFYAGDAEPNFVTLKRITEIVVLESDLQHANLKDKIIMIRSADPGYDWIFSREIGGLITMYGGSNSHMAIRCAELQIPSAIGCGQRSFDVLSKSKRIEIDCASRIIRPV